MMNYQYQKQTNLKETRPPTKEYKLQEQKFHPATLINHERQLIKEPVSKTENNELVFLQY